jgi:hypothetical protein
MTVDGNSGAVRDPGRRRRWSVGLGGVLATVLATMVTAGTSQAGPASGTGPATGGRAYLEAAAPRVVTPHTTTGWRGKYTYAVSAGLHKLFFHYSCPAGTRAVSGGFNGDAATQDKLQLIGEGPRWDLGAANYTEWFWLFVWPAGAPGGATIDFDVDCG